MSDEVKKKKTVLIVDDIKMMRMILVKMLSSAGYKLAEASSGNIVLDILNEKSIDLMVIDINMPGMSGLEVVRAIRSIPKYVDLPVIMCTAKSEKSSIIEAVDLGINGFLIKPVQEKVLLEKVSQCFE